MQNYKEFLEYSIDALPEGFQVLDDELYFHGINLMELVESYGTPLRFTFLPIISKQIQRAKLFFKKAFLKNDYRGNYIYCYCTKSSHFKHILEEALKNDIHLEISSVFDIAIIYSLFRERKISKDTMIVCNGPKPQNYLQRIADLIHDNFKNVIPVLDSKDEFKFYAAEFENRELQLGIRVAIEEQPEHELYSSRFGIRPEEVLDFYKHKIKNFGNFKVTMMHFFVESGIDDTPYYWNELEKMINLYCKFKEINPDLKYLNIGGGLPYRNSLFFEFDYEFIINEIVGRIKQICQKYDVPEPTIVTEFGSYTVAESSGIIFKVMGRKKQNDKEKWLVLDGSLMTTMPDIWALKQRYILLPLNNWDAPYDKFILGGLTCDSNDYYANDAHTNVLFLPKTRKNQYLAFFHTGAYQENLSGVGGIHHCLIPTPKHILLSRGQDGSIVEKTFMEEQNSKDVLRILGYL